MSGNKVSVIIPAFNPGRFIDLTVRSVLEQTFENFEVIIVDDGSSEDLSRLDKLDARVTVQRQKHRGVSSARNLGIEVSTGDLIAFLDADDLWEPVKLQTQVEHFKRYPTVDMTYTDFAFISDTGRETGQGWAGSAIRYEQLLLGCCICTSTVMLRRDCLTSVGRFDELYLIAQDYDLWLRIALHQDVEHIAQPLTMYRTHAANCSANYLRTARETENILLKNLTHARSTGNSEAIASIRNGLRLTRNTFAHQAFDNCRIKFRNRQWVDLFRHLCDTIILSRSLSIPVKSLLDYHIRKSGMSAASTG